MKPQNAEDPWHSAPDTGIEGLISLLRKWRDVPDARSFLEYIVRRRREHLLALADHLNLSDVSLSPLSD